MATPANGDYVFLTDCKVWWDGRSNEIHLTINDPDLHLPGSQPGARVIFSANPKSANYHPRNYNLFARLLRQYDKLAPEHDVKEGPRRLDKRHTLYSTLHADKT